MTFQAVPNGAEVAFHATLNDQQVVNTMFFTHPTFWDNTNLDDLVEAVGIAWATEIVEHLATTYIYTGCHARDLRTEIGFQADDDAGAGPGSVGGGGLPNNCSLAVCRRSALAGRGARGRIFVAGIPYSVEETPNHVSQAFADAMTAGLDAVQEAADGVGWTEVIVHRVAAGVPLVPAIVYTVIEHAVVDLVIDSMRGRLPGRGT